MRLRTILPLALATSLGGCAAAATGPVTGDWGGEHVGLHLGPTGGTLDYDCASGTIGPVIPDAGGRFAADGTHSPGHGGPVRQDEVPQSFPAHYSGTVSGDRMTLGGHADNGADLGPFTLRRGEAPKLLRCL